MLAIRALAHWFAGGVPGIQITSATRQIELGVHVDQLATYVVYASAAGLVVQVLDLSHLPRPRSMVKFEPKSRTAAFVHKYLARRELRSDRRHNPYFGIWVHKKKVQET